MKKLKCLLLVALAVFALVGCASNSGVMGANVPNEENAPINDSMSAPTNANINLN